MFVIGGLSGHLPRLGADRHPRERHVLRRRPHPLRALRRLALHDLRRHLLLVPEDDRADVQRDASGRIHFWLTFVGFNVTFFPMHWVGPPGDAAPRRRLRARVRQLEHGHLDRVVRPGRLDDRLPLQHDRELAARADRAREPVARAHARVAGVLAAADLQLRRDPAGRRQPVRVRHPRSAPRRPEREADRGRQAAGDRGGDPSTREPVRAAGPPSRRAPAPHPRARERDGRRAGRCSTRSRSAPRRARSG